PDAAPYVRLAGLRAGVPQRPLHRRTTHARVDALGDPLEDVVLDPRGDRGDYVAEDAGPGDQAAEHLVEQPLGALGDVADAEVADALDEPADDPAEREVPREPRDHTAAREREPFPADRVWAGQPLADTLHAAPAGNVVGLDHEALADRLGELGPENALTRADSGNEGVDARPVARHDAAARELRDLVEARLDPGETGDLIDELDNSVVVKADDEIDGGLGDSLQAVPDALDSVHGGTECVPHLADRTADLVERGLDARVPHRLDGGLQAVPRLACHRAQQRERGAKRLGEVAPDGVEDALDDAPVDADRGADAVPDGLDDVVVQPPENRRQNLRDVELDQVEIALDQRPCDLDVDLDRDPHDFDQVPEEDECAPENSADNRRDCVKDRLDDRPRVLDDRPDRRKHELDVGPVPPQSRPDHGHQNRRDLVEDRLDEAPCRRYR